MSGRHVTVHYPAPIDSRFAADTFEAQRGNWPPLTDGDGTPIGDVVGIRVSPDGSAAIITAKLYPSIADQHDERFADLGVEHCSIGIDKDEQRT